MENNKASQAAMCAKCGHAPRRAKHRWCNACYNAYNRERELTLHARLKAIGAGELRVRLVGMFENIGAGQMTGYTAAELVRKESEPRVATAAVA